MDRLEDGDGHRASVGTSCEASKETKETALMYLHPINPKALLRISNPSRGTKIFLGIVLAAVVGGGIYFGTRRSAAAKAAKKAFEVSGDCQTVVIVDDAEAKNAVMAAALAVRPSSGDPAVVAAGQILNTLFPQCDWQTIPDDREFVHGDRTYTWGSVKLLLVGRTVGEVTSMVTGNAQGHAPSIMPSLFAWMMTR